ncbi:MAG: response regulator [Phototrophicaceae bacterium]
MLGKILIVDDEELNREMLTRRLERLGYPSDAAQNGQQALEMLQQSHYDLVLLDVMMPIMNGLETLRAIRSVSRFALIPVIMLSGVDDLDLISRLIETGADDYLFKPFNATLLKARLEASLHKRQALLQAAALAMLAPDLVAMRDYIHNLKGYVPDNIYQDLCQGTDMILDKINRALPKQP